MAGQAEQGPWSGWPLRAWLRQLAIGAALAQLGLFSSFAVFVESGGKVVMEAEHFQTNRRRRARRGW